MVKTIAQYAQGGIWRNMWYQHMCVLTCNLTVHLMSSISHAGVIASWTGRAWASLPVAYCRYIMHSCWNIILTPSHISLTPLFSHVTLCTLTPSLITCTLMPFPPLTPSHSRRTLPRPLTKCAVSFKCSIRRLTPVTVLRPCRSWNTHSLRCAVTSPKAWPPTGENGLLPPQALPPRRRWPRASIHTQHRGRTWTRQHCATVFSLHHINTHTLYWQQACKKHKAWLTTVCILIDVSLLYHCKRWGPIHTNKNPPLNRSTTIGASAVL